MLTLHIDPAHANSTVAFWVRVSSDAQSTASQTHVLREWAERRGWTVGKTFEVAESAYQGRHLAALSEVYASAAMGEFGILDVFALDRLSRQGKGATLEIVDRLGRLDVSVVSYSEPWLEAGEGAMRELLLALAGWISKQESARRSERTRVGLAKALSMGKRLGRPPGKTDTKTRKKSGYFARGQRLREEGRVRTKQT